ncbi:MAG: hypothetical protein MPI95_03015 [Nitrosopumilus sp.]|nr:hypothetical protein [Nitrosopumilus sp.]CAI9832558.1 conserved hypothetical protein [Nitrosopumilaceae archaeon]MDA7941047.1 hypothetical protein [Nitrosopumilus sp.]MDA7942555.1 hypothetical protein [Nitrosopumilus sp.]MDA7944483.1 hypothetical protein [Nitrosopumilus sp.]
MASRAFPDWVSAEIRDAEFGDPAEMRRTGYILEIYEGDSKMDVQLYDPVEDGRYIVTMDVPGAVGMGDLERGIVYEFVFEQQSAPLSKKVSEYLASEMGTEMGAIYRFVLVSLERADSE